MKVLSNAEPDSRAYLNALFKYVPDAVVKALSHRTIAKGQYLIHAETPCDTVYFILSGKVAGLDHQSHGRVYYFMDFAQMHVVGDFEVFGDIPNYCVSICAAENSEILTLSSSLYVQWVQHDENALFLRIKHIIAMLTFEKKSEREYIFLNCRERLTKYLVKSYENRKNGNAGNHKISMTHLELSERVGFNVRSVQRGIAALEKDGLISIETGKIMISKEQYEKLKLNEGGDDFA